MKAENTGHCPSLVSFSRFSAVLGLHDLRAMNENYYRGWKQCSPGRAGEACLYELLEPLLALHGHIQAV